MTRQQDDPGKWTAYITNCRIADWIGFHSVLPSLSRPLKPHTSGTTYRKTGPPQKNSKILLTGVHIYIYIYIYNGNIKRWTKREKRYYRSSGIFCSTVLKLNIQHMWVLNFAYLVYTLFLSKQCDALSNGNCQ